MKPPRFLRYLSRWNRRAVVFFAGLLLCFWLGCLVLGMFPLQYGHFTGHLLIMGLTAAVAVVLFAIWLTLLISPGIPRQERPVRETGTRLAAAGVCLLLVAIAILAGGGPLVLGRRLGGKLEISLGPLRDLQHSPAVQALAAGTKSTLLPPEDWPESMKRLRSAGFGAWAPAGIEVFPSSPGDPKIRILYGRGHPDILIQSREPREKSHPEDFGVDQWADDVWLCWNKAD